jgi:hypothetical protein
VQGIISWFGIKGLLPATLGMDIGLDTLGEPIRAHLVPGETDDVAMVVAGVHGSEQSGVEVAERLLQQLAVNRPYYTVVVVPRLFPDNVASRAAWEKKLAADQGKITLKEYRKVRAKAGDPNRATAGQVDPNRQFPELGDDLDLAKPVDAKGRPVEPGNLALLALIKAFAPTRIVSIHAQKDLDKAGVFSDPQPAVAPGALASEADRIAVATAKRAQVLGARVAGNTNAGGWSSLYPGQDPKISKAQMKKENARGRSFGQWGPSKGIAVLTVEVAEQYDSSGAVDDPKRAPELEAHATAIREIVLGPPGASGSAPTPAKSGAGSQPVQKMVVQQIATDAGNRAAGAVIERMRIRG